jgi:hypothetical protein
MTDEPKQVQINEVRTDLIVTEGVGPLSKADVQQLVSIVMAQVRHEQNSGEQREKDTAITNRVYPPHLR